uniref:Uncharacterized protein n=2 Tax=Latimeria chalumnae TaxID=7897 RepID=H3AEW8_LATCH|nr:PREDICTED: uncharacterized protein C7orf57 homolog [Latimeria chalumnae]|eukprot:XP_014353006.1 PREDICTED: uncharacterized protein C7orf57 homolog [Latimeria chalumnae]
MKLKDKSVPASGPSKYSTCNWFYHAPLKMPDKSAYKETHHPPTSQIPSLSDLAEPDNKQCENRKMWIRETDSDYVKLAKQGGRPDLLRHKEPAPLRSPVPYFRPEWFIFDEQLPPVEEKQAPTWCLPDYMVHEEFSASRNDSQPEKGKGLDDGGKTIVWHQDVEDSEKEKTEKGKLRFPAIPEKSNHLRSTEVQSSALPTTTALKNHITFPLM